MTSVFTIGHSTHTIGKLIDLLQRNEITAIADVRSQPWSRMNPQFNRDSLTERLGANGIHYVFLGQELGARTDDRSCYVNGKVQYDRLAQTTHFQRGLDRVERGSREQRIALMCAEKDPLTCHRTILVCRHLVDRGIDVQHILDSGAVEPHSSAVSRLLMEERLPQHDLFRSRSELEHEAYARRGERIAYVDASSAGDEPQAAE